MATFYEKNGECIERKNNVQVDPEDTIIWMLFKDNGSKKRSEISNETWNKIIARDDTMIIVDKNKRESCSGEKRMEAKHDVCHIIGILQNNLLRDYNDGLPNYKKHKNFGKLHEWMVSNSDVNKRASSILSNYGMTVNHVNLLYAYKSSRNKEAHKDSLNRSRYALAPDLSQQGRNALKLLLLAPNQQQGFSEAFEPCVRWLYRRN